MQVINQQTPAKPTKIQQKRQRKLQSLTGKAIADYNMVTEGDKIMVCLSGGKDSYVMLDMLLRLQKKAPIKFDLIAVNLDQKQPGFPEHILPEYLSSLGVEYHIIEQDTYSIVKEIIPAGKTTCGLCSRLRRGILYSFATQHNCHKIALGHHRDDRVETLFLNMFFGSKLKSMPPKLFSDDGKHTVIRPLSYCAEVDIAEYAHIANYPIIPCNLCGSQDNMQRQAIKMMLQDWDKINPGRIENISRALSHVVPSHLADTQIYNFIKKDIMLDVSKTIS
ncbi:MAG: tRNA 2-thiocytidine(32) synthetase TtcA [Proteobacteria bacterium]|nr:tRNA 2-thiocytidine(32) synthetase TtcA [Pseudomonadota bacterium]